MKNTIKLSTLLLLSLSSFASDKQNTGKPNIIVFIADDAGMDFGCYGNKAISTPNIDRLAESGIKFEKAFVTSPQSSPSRTSIMSGKFAHTIGTEDLHVPLNENTKILPAYLKDCGYFTAHMLKTHWGENADRQFDMYRDGHDIYKENPVTYNNMGLSEYRDILNEAANRNKPLFLWIGLRDPHRPYKDLFISLVNDYKTVDVPPYLVDSELTRRDMEDYYNEVSRLDYHIGLYMDELRKRNLLENTIIIFLSDNGYPFPRGKASLYDSGIQTPLIISWQGKIPAGFVHSNGLVSTVDLAPTILDIAGAQVPDDMFGTGFKEILFNPSLPGNKEIYAERNWHDTDEYIRCIRTDKYKLIYNAYTDLPFGITLDMSTSDAWYELLKHKKSATLNEAQMSQFTYPRPMIELYDLENDPYELNNIAGLRSSVAVIKKLGVKLINWQKQTHDNPHYKNRHSDNNCRVTGAPFWDSKGTRGPLDNWDE